MDRVTVDGDKECMTDAAAGVAVGQARRRGGPRAASGMRSRPAVEWMPESETGSSKEGPNGSHESSSEAIASRSGNPVITG
jgi:hypothetical protein